MRRGLVAAVALSAGLAVVLSACSSSKSSSSSGGSGGGGGGNTTLKLVAADYGTGPSNTSQKYWEGIASDFHAANPNITVNVQTINWNDFDNQVKTQVQNKQYPDVLEGDYFPDYAQSGLLYAAKDVTSPSTFSNLLPVFAKLNTYNGTQYGMPFTTSSRTLFYNKKLFQQAGITSAPQTWADVQTDAAKIKSARQGRIRASARPGGGPGRVVAVVPRQRRHLQDDSGKWMINSSQNVETQHFLTDLVKSGVTEPNPGTKNRTDLWKQFAQGDIGMINGSPALIPIIQAGGKLTDSDWASVPIPGKSGPLDKTLGVCDNVSCSRRTAASRLQSRSSWTSSTRTSTKSSSTRSTTCFRRPTRRSRRCPRIPSSARSSRRCRIPSSTPALPCGRRSRPRSSRPIATAITQDPKKVLDSIQQTATKGS